MGQKAVGVNETLKDYVSFSTRGMWGMWGAGVAFGILFFMPSMTHIFPTWVWAIAAGLVLFVSNLMFNIKAVMAIQKVTPSEI